MIQDWFAEYEFWEENHTWIFVHVLKFKIDQQIFSPDSINMKIKPSV